MTLRVKTAQGCLVAGPGFGLRRRPTGGAGVGFGPASSQRFCGRWILAFGHYLPVFRYIDDLVI